MRIFTLSVNSRAQLRHADQRHGCVKWGKATSRKKTLKNYTKNTVRPKIFVLGDNLILTEQLAWPDTHALRIGPNELHITDVNLYKVIYSKSSLFPKYAPFYDGFNTPHTVFTECDPPFHKELHRLLNPRFSHVGLSKLEPIIQQKIKMLVGKIHFLAVNGPVNVYDAFR